MSIGHELGRNLRLSLQFAIKNGNDLRTELMKLHGSHGWNDIVPDQRRITAVGGAGPVDAPVKLHIFFQKLSKSSGAIFQPLPLLLLDDLQLFLSSQGLLIVMIGLPLLFLLVSIVDGVDHAEAFVSLNN